MSVNNYRAHVLVLPEDDANRQIANGFMLDPSINPRNIQTLPPAGGWNKVREDFINTQVNGLRNYKERHLVLLIDFDEQVESRKSYFREIFPSDVIDRVYMLGTFSEPEPLRRECRKSLENIGKSLANECARNTPILWSHELLKHNEAERQRLNADVKSFLFSTT